MAGRWDARTLATGGLAVAGLAVAALVLRDASRHDPLDVTWRTAQAAVFLIAVVASYVGLIALHVHRRVLSPRSALACVLAYSLAAALAVGELAMTQVDRSHTVGYTLAAKLWFRRHWRLNELGYRGRVWTDDDLKHRKLVLVAGDSLTVGHGIEDVADTYCTRLGERLGPVYRTVNMGVNGADTRTELVRLEMFPTRPHAIVLQYFGNDIIEGAKQTPLEAPQFTPYISLPRWLINLVSRSYLVNFLYWSLPRADLDAFWTYVYNTYRRPDLRARHARELRAVAAHARRLKVPLVVVLFPYLHDLPGSDLYLPWVREIFESEGVPVLDVTPLVRDLPVAARVVGPNDMHPSRAVHRLVGDALYRLLVERGIAE